MPLMGKRSRRCLGEVVRIVVRIRTFTDRYEFSLDFGGQEAKIIIVGLAASL